MSRHNHNVSYNYNQMLAHVLGYVGEISPEQLENFPKFKSKGYKPGDIIGVEGIEAVL